MGERLLREELIFEGGNQERVGQLLEAIETAGQAVLAVYNSPEAGEFNTKADGSAITPADIASNEILLSALGQLFPGVPIVSEEGDEEYNRSAISTEQFWLVDPLDGTGEFLKRSGDFTICVALVENGRPSFGIVSAPALGVTYFGGPGLGSYRLRDGVREPIQVGENTGIVFGSRSSFDDATAAYIAEQYPGYTIRSVGSQLKLPYIAEGLGDAYPRLRSPLFLWDLAAGEAILCGAGGRVTRIDGGLVDYANENMRVGDFVASNT